MYIFLDDGGVMNDNAVRGPQWQALVAEFFPPILGGDAAAWAEANRAVVDRFLPVWSGQRVSGADTPYLPEFRQEQIDWLTWMCELVGVAPPGEEDCFYLACEADAHITRRVRSAFPGAVDAIRALAGKGHALYTASGEHSLTLEGYLEGMGVRGAFSTLYGPDLVDVSKHTAVYYERMFGHAGVDPCRAVVVDDSLGALRRARAAGARTVLVSQDGALEAGSDVDAVVRSLAGLPALLEDVKWA